MKKFLLMITVVALVAVTPLMILGEEEMLIVEASMMNPATPENNGLYVGTVTEFDRESARMTITGTQMGDVIVHLPEDILATLPELYAGVPVKVQTNGIAALSLPAQVTAEGVEVFVAQGTVEGIEHGMLTIDMGEGGKMMANLSGGVTVYGLEHFAPGAQVSAYYNGVATRSMPPQISPAVLVFAPAQ